MDPDASELAQSDITTPGVLNIIVQNAPGEAITQRSVTNRASTMLFTMIQEHTNYSKPYQPSDAMMMILAQREIVGLFHHIAKIFRIAKHHAFDNAYLPRAVITGMGIDYDDLILNYANYRKEVELLAVEASQLRIPRIPLMDRTAQLYGSWFKDDNIAEEKTPTYVFSPASYGVFTISSGDVAAGFIRCKPFTSSFSTITTLRTYIDATKECIDGILNDTNFKLISGDLGRTFDAFFDINDLNLDGVQVPYYDEYSLAQINNLNTLPIRSSLLPVSIPWATDDNMESSTWNIVQDTEGAGTIQYSPEYSISVPADFSAAVMQKWVNGLAITNLPWSSKATTDMVIDATRLKSFWGVLVDNGTALFKAGVIGTEIPITMCYVRFNPDKSIYRRFMSTHYMGNSGGQGNYQCTNFTHFPMSFIFDVTSGDWSSTSIINPHLNNYRTFRRDDYAYMNKAAQYSLFGLTKLLKR